MMKDRRPGISFVVRCHNEQDTIFDCLNSLNGITVPYEVVVFLHRCTDSSKQIVEGLKDQGFPVRIYEYDLEISRAGYETLVTAVNDPHSIMSYYNFCFDKANYNWLVKWDADFKASGGLINFFNSLDISDKNPTSYRITAMLGDKPTSEPYMNNCLIEYTKYFFWETPRFLSGMISKTAPDDALIHSVPVSVIKNYWYNSPWFVKPESHEQEIINKLRIIEERYGKEPAGFARSCNQELDGVFFAIKNDEELLKQLGISFYF